MFTTFLLLLQSQDKRSGGTSLKSLLAPRAKAVSKSRLPTPTIRAPMATGNSCSSGRKCQVFWAEFHGPSLVVQFLFG